MEIKFRAWNKQYKVMTKVFILDWWNREIKVNEEMGSDTFILMQFTGLYDKNKKSIFEGDIILGYPTSEKQPTLVESLEIFFWFIGEYTIEREKMEIIGNIYENPELLK